LRVALAELEEETSPHLADAAEHKDVYGVESMCAVLPIAPSTFHEHVRRSREPERRPPRTKRDEELCTAIRRVYDESRQRYGADEVWRQLNEEGVAVARCTVERLMAQMGLPGVTRDHSDTSHLALSKKPTTLRKSNRLWWPDSTENVSGISGGFNLTTRGAWDLLGCALVGNSPIGSAFQKQ
jgi:hypothetical protein